MIIITIEGDEKPQICAKVIHRQFSTDNNSTNNVTDPSAKTDADSDDGDGNHFVSILCQKLILK